MNVSQLLDVMVLTLIWAGIAAAWNFLAGFGGQFSLGHAAFVGIGAYGAALAATRYGLTPWIGLLAGMFLAGLLALFYRFDQPAYARAIFHFADHRIRRSGPSYRTICQAFYQWGGGNNHRTQARFVEPLFFGEVAVRSACGNLCARHWRSVRRRSPLSPRLPFAGGARRRGCSAVAGCAGIPGSRDGNGHQRRVCGGRAARYLRCTRSSSIQTVPCRFFFRSKQV